MLLQIVDKSCSHILKKRDRQTDRQTDREKREQKTIPFSENLLDSPFLDPDFILFARCNQSLKTGAYHHRSD